MLDQVFKYFVISHNFFYYKNSGFLFGLINDVPIFLLAAILIVLYIVIARCHDPWRSGLYPANTRNDAGWILLLSGAVSNLVDRFSRGYVVDYLDWKMFLPFWPEGFVRYFNLADVFVVIGLIAVGKSLSDARHLEVRRS